MRNFQKYWSQNVGQDFNVLYIFFTGGRFWKLTGGTEGTLKIGRKMLPPEDSHVCVKQFWVYEKCKLFQTITCSKISNIPYNLIYTTKFNDSSILITIISCDYLNLSLVNEYGGCMLVTSQYQPRLSSIAKKNSRQISQSDCSIQIKLNYLRLFCNIIYGGPKMYDIE